MSITLHIRRLTTADKKLSRAETARLKASLETELARLISGQPEPPRPARRPVGAEALGVTMARTIHQRVPALGKGRVP